MFPVAAERQTELSNFGRWSKEGPMNIISILITAVGLSMDAFAVSITNGMCTRYLRFLSLIHI